MAKMDKSIWLSFILGYVWYPWDGAPVSDDIASEEIEAILDLRAFLLDHIFWISVNECIKDPFFVVVPQEQ